MKIIAGVPVTSLPRAFFALKIGGMKISKSLNRETKNLKGFTRLALLDCVHMILAHFENGEKCDR